MFARILEQLTRDSIVYGLLFALSRSFGIITFPIISRIFIPADYGVLDLIGVTSAIIYSIVTLGISGAVFRQFYDHDCRGQVILVSTSFWYQIAITTVFVFITLMTLAGQFSIWLLKTPSYVLAIQIALVNVPIAVMDGFFIDLLRLLRRKWTYLAFSLVSSILTVLLTIFFVAKLRMGVVGALLSGFLVHLLFASVKVYFLRNLFTFAFNFDVLKKLLKFSVPLVPAPLLSWITLSSNRYIMQYFTSLGEIGLLSTAFKMSSFAAIFFSMIQYAWSPIAYSIYKEVETPKVFSRVLIVVAIVSTFISMASTIFARNILALLAPRAYLNAYRSVGPITFSNTIYTMFYMLSIGALVGDKPRYYTFAHLIGAMVSVISSFALIPLYGMVGAAWGLFFSRTATTVYIYSKAQSVYRVPYEVPKLIKILLIGAILSWIGAASSTPLFAKIGLSALYPVTLYILKVISKSDITGAVRAAGRTWQSRIIFVSKKARFQQLPLDQVSSSVGNESTRVSAGHHEK